MIYGTSEIEQGIRRGDIRYEVLPECASYHNFRVQGVQIDIQVGHHVWYHRPVAGVFDLNRDDPKKLFRYQDARKPYEWRSNGDVYLIPAGKIVLPPGVPMLLHSVQAIGSQVNGLSTIFDGRSTVGRFAVHAHINAGRGDPKYAWVWVLEGLNSTQNVYVMDVGSYLGSIVFEEVKGDVLAYPDEGRYQSRNLSEWTPASMLPRRGNL